MEGYITVAAQSVGEYEEKRSKFIANLKPVESEEEAINFIKEIRSKYWDARHNVFAYRIKGGQVRFSDDGEPHSTAGKPVLDIITGRKLENVCIVVTRYFGGILLGTGGLVRAYSEAAKNACDNAETIEMGLIGLYSVECDYQQYNRFVPFAENMGASVIDTVFEEQVSVKISMAVENFCKELIDTFAGRLCLKENGKIFAKIKNI